jgi:1,4-alpha-glucan branching enzyme
MVTGATSLIGDTDLHLFNEGSHLRLWEKLGAHPGTSGARAGTHFAVWAPGAERVSVIGDCNGWNRDAVPLAPRGVRDLGRLRAGRRARRAVQVPRGVTESDPAIVATIFIAPLPSSAAPVSEREKPPS